MLSQLFIKLHRVRFLSLSFKIVYRNILSLTSDYFKMKLLIVVCLALIAAVVAEEKYTTKYDNIDVDEILKSDRLFNNYFKCLMDTGKCTPDARELKKSLPDALKTECSKCSEKQKKTADKVLRHIIDHKQAEWKQLQAKYDPDNIYFNKYKGRAEEAGIKLPN